MNSIMYNLFRAYIGDISSNEEITQLVSKLQTDLLNQTSGEENRLFNRYMEAKTEEGEILSYESFKKGFKTGVTLIIEVLNEHKDLYTGF